MRDGNRLQTAGGSTQVNVTVDRVTTTPRASAEIGLAGGTQSPRLDSRTSAWPRTPDPDGHSLGLPNSSQH